MGRVALIAWLLIPVLGASHDTATKELTVARSILKKAVQNTRKSQPSPAELQAASAALEALKRVIGDGVELEATDARYAKAAQAARRDVATQGLDLAIGKLNANAQHKGRVLTLENLKAAEAALVAAFAALEEARPFGKGDASFAMYLSGLDGSFAHHQQGFDEHWTRLLGERRQAQKLAAGDARREAAKALAELLDESKAAQVRNPTFRALADSARAELAAEK